MDRRKRTLGSRITANNMETNDVKPSRTHDCEQNIDTESIQGKSLKNKQRGLCQPSTPKRESSGKEVKLESPAIASPLQSPGYQTMFPKSFGSPEIEVSWDWGCSQVPREMLPPRAKKKIKTPQPVPVLVPNITYGPRLPELQISEEENQERLAFYKSILSKSSKCTPAVSDDSEINSALDSAIHSDPNAANCITPKRCTLLKGNNCEDQISALFDDSANELMFECSQAVEEKIAKGEIDVQSSVNVNIPHPKHPLSPYTNYEHIHKKVCHGKSKLNLFPETSNNIGKLCKIGEPSPKKKQCLGISSAHFNMLKCYSNLKPTKLIDSLQKQNDENVSTEPPKQAVVLGEKLNGKNLKFSVTLNNNNYQDNTLPNRYPIVSHNPVVNRCSKQVSVHPSDSSHKRNDRNMNSSSNLNKNIDIQKKGLSVNNNNELEARTQLDGKISDVKSLLEDEFDNELSSIDFDSLCQNLTSGSHNQTSAVSTASGSQAHKICSQQEIEQKRIAALNRLKTKKKKTLL